MSATMLLSISNKETATVGRKSFTHNSCHYSRKKTRLGNNPFPDTNRFKGSENFDVTPFKRCVSFESNVTSLCGRFPEVHQGLISSLLESTSNDPDKASCLIQQVAESTKKCAEHHHSSVDNAHRTKRQERDWGDQMIDDGQSPAQVPCGGVSVTEDDVSVDDDEDDDGGAIGTSCLSERTVKSDIVNNIIPNSQLQSEIAASPSESRTSIDKQNSVPALEPPAALDQLPTPGSGQDIPAASGPRSSHIRLLARVVLSQFEKINHLQTSNARLEEENGKLKAELHTTVEELKRCRESNLALQYYLSIANPVALSSTTVGGGTLGGHGSSGGLGFNNHFDNHDVC